jgi:crossover junction endodeoxyribonuclease RusA
MRSCKAPLEGRLSVEILCYPPDNRKRDLDNLPKAVLDACTHAGVWLDDSQIDHLEITRCDTRRPGHVLVSVKTIDDLVCFTLVL